PSQPQMWLIKQFFARAVSLSSRISPCKDPILRNIEEYSLVIPTSTDSEGRFLSHLVSGPPRARFRRAVDDLQREAANEQIFYNVTVFGREFHFRLRPNSRLVAPGATVEWQEDSDETRIEPLYGNCLYVGDITDLPNASVAISNCDGLVSYFFPQVKQLSVIHSARLCVLKLAAAFCSGVLFSSQMITACS
uniref:Peptidase M12B propeptide domain-containing protein n=1 Tax=Meleagris gallopavo TaxID=9103 RepID=G3UUR1_MELGA